MMKRLKPFLCFGLIFIIAGCVYADTRITAYGVYWDGDDAGRGIGLRVRKTMLAFLAVEGSTAYIEFTDSNTELVPLEAAVLVRAPFVISPYAGLGAGYYFVDSDVPGTDDFSGGFAQLGVEASLLWLGVMAEVRYYEMEENYWDGAVYNLGVLLKF